MKPWRRSNTSKSDKPRSGGEALFLLLPVIYYCAAATIRDIIEDWRERR